MMKRGIIVVLLLIVMLSGVTEIGVGYTIERVYQWHYGDKDWTWTLYVDSQTYQFYKDLPRVNDLSIYVTTPYDDKFLSSLVDFLRQSARDVGYDEWDTVNLLISFVQSLPYTSDRASTGYDEYPRYPIETLVDNGGDCEDTAILTAALLWQMGYDVVLLRYPHHVAVGVAGDNTINGTYYEYNGRRYFCNGPGDCYHSRESRWR